MAARGIPPVLQAEMEAVITHGQEQLALMHARYSGMRTDFTPDPEVQAQVARLPLKECVRICGAVLGNPSKMPGLSFGTPAAACQTGGELRDVVGTVCEFCYAYETDNYRWPAVVAAGYRRLLAIEEYTRGGNPLFPYALARLITHYSARVKNDDGTVGTDVFRFHDQGDLQSVAYLQAICLVATLTPHIRHWLPSREAHYLFAFHKAGHVIPANLQINFSVHRRNAKPVNLHTYTKMNMGISFVVDDGNMARYDGVDIHLCPAPEQGHKCGPCRRCWGSAPAADGIRPSQPIIVYKFH